MITIKRLENLQVWSQSQDGKTFKYDHNQKIEKPSSMIIIKRLKTFKYDHNQQIEKPSSMITIKRLENFQVWSQSKDWNTFKYDHNQKIGKPDNLKVFGSKLT
jgi:5-enolpyruvylshikimate-3-phosphate synthase